jgi:hypothetical protein
MLSSLKESGFELIGELKIVSRTCDDFVKLCRQFDNLYFHRLSFSDNFESYTQDDTRLMNFENRDDIFALTVVNFLSESEYKFEVNSYIFGDECNYQIPNVSEVELWEEKEIDYDLDCPNARVIHNYFYQFGSEVQSGKSSKSQELCKNYLVMLQRLLTSESRLRNLDNVVGRFGHRVGELLRLMRLICLGLNTSQRDLNEENEENQNILSTFLTKDLYDPRLLILIAQLVDQYSIVFQN